MSHRSRRTEGIVLRCVDYGDADRIVAFLTPDLGRVSALARSARKSRKRFGGALQSGHRVAIELAFGRGDLARLESAESIETFGGLLTDLQRLRFAGEAVGFVRDAVLPGLAEPELYAAVVSYSRWQAERPADERLLLAFQIRVLALLGHAPEVDACAQCGREVPEGRAALFDPRRGAVVCRACGGGPAHLSGATRTWVRRAVASLEADVEWPEETRREIREALSPFVRLQLDRQRTCRRPDGF